MPYMSGKCICGAVSYKLPDQHYDLWACHCDTCRQWTSGILFSLSPSDPVFKGEENIAVYKSTEMTERAFCRICGSNLYFKTVATNDEVHQQKATLNICAGTLDDYKNIKLVREVFVDACPNAYALENKNNDRQVLTRAEYDR
jgi:hypothetical protein